MDISTGLAIFSSIVSTIDLVKELCPLYLRKKAEMEVYIDIFKEQLTESLNEIPNESRQEPKNSIVWPAFESSIFYLEEETYRDMFSKLISSSCDNRKQNNVHACFIEIIKQMDPLDAKIIKTFKKNSRQPIVEFRLIQNDGFTVYLTNSFLLNSDDELYTNSSSITNLVRLGLVSIDYDTYFTEDKEYANFENHPQYNKLKNHVKHERLRTGKGPNEIKYQKGLVTLTPLGKDFIKVCIE